MSIEKTKRRRKAAADPSEPPPVDESPALQAEVRAFASQLGLASGGADHAFDDFAPQQAKDKLPSKKGKSAQPADDDGVDGGDVPAPAAGRKHSGTRKAAAAVAGQQAAQPSVIPPVSDAMAEAIRTRGWREGVGPRPGKLAAVTHVQPISVGLVCCDYSCSLLYVTLSSGDGKRSLLGRDAPGLWYEALAALPPQPSADAAAPPVSDAKV
jgi:hypothetical protein